MKSMCVRTLIFTTLLAVALFGLASPAAHAAHCTMSRAVGKYGFTLNGVLITAAGTAPVGAVGTATVDAAGNVTGTEARSIGGSYADETYTGTLAVNSDCTGTLTVNFYESGQLVRTSVLSTVSDDNQKQLRGVQKSLTLPNGAMVPVVLTLESRRMFTDQD